MKKIKRRVKNRKNKLAAAGFLAVSGLGMLLTKDATVFLLAVVISIPIFFGKIDIFE